MFNRSKAMSWYVAVYVPSTTDVNTLVKNGVYVKYVMSKLSKRYGGATAVQTRGAWMSDSQGLIVEKTVLVYAYTNRITRRDRRALNALATWLKASMKQESVAVEIRKQNGGLTLV